MSQKYNGLEKV